MVGTNHVGYTDRFHKLAKLVPHLVTLESKRNKRYINGLAPQIRRMLRETLPTTIQSAILKAGILTNKAFRCITLTKSSEKRKEVEKQVTRSQARNCLALEGNRNTQNNRNQAKERAFSVNSVDALQDPNVVMGTFSLNDHFATILFDFGADFSFISTKFTPLLNVKPSIVSPGYVIEVANDLIPFGHGSFDVIVGMDWLSKNKAEIVCHEKVVRIPLEGSEILRVQGERTLGGTKTLMSTRSDELELSDIPITKEDHGVHLKLVLKLLKKERLMWIELFNDYECEIRYHPEADKMYHDLQDMYWWPGPFEILDRVGPVAYRLRLTEKLSSVHETFHVLNLKKCLADANLHVPLDEIKIDKTLRFVEEPVEIIDREEREDHVKAKYPRLFVDCAVESTS
uniref:Reverse transcriptase domain-containing protein n=1 Tax=Tanacetum cinerariifolium TaxID=118510 RepID=A0A6L2NMS0_TANCI|nr:reverse transcriptase domain-containing protein [Tanacetum cinerariifolium]